MVLPLLGGKPSANATIVSSPLVDSSYATSTSSFGCCTCEIQKPIPRGHKLVFFSFSLVAFGKEKHQMNRGDLWASKCNVDFPQVEDKDLGILH